MTYQEFIQNIIDTRGQWNIPPDEYYERHHIVPKCMGGECNLRHKNRKVLYQHPNIIYLYAREHFIAHKLLALENPENKSLVLAWSMMAFPKGKTSRDFEITPEEYEQLRILQANVLLGTHLSEETRQKLSEINKGKHLSQETKEKISKGNKNKILSDEVKNKMSEAQKLRFKLHPETCSCGTKNKICITNGTINKYINKEDEIPEGYYRGQTSNKISEVYINAWTEERKKNFSEKISGVNNPNYGNGIKQSGGNNSNAKYIYTFEGVDYLCRDDLMKVLIIKFPKISESTIRRIMSGQYTIRTSKNYQYVIDNLTWRLKDKDENKIN